MIDRGHRMLAQVDQDIHKVYFDSTFGGRDLAARYRTADSAISAAPTNNHILAAIAQYVSELDDSHTFFLPPDHADEVDYGFTARFVGDTCFIVGVKKGSDAEAKGIKRGDALLQLDVFPITRPTYETVQYVYGLLSPRPRVRLTVRSPEGAQRTLDVLSKVKVGRRNYDLDDVETFHRLVDEYEGKGVANNQVVELGDSVVVWKMAEFIEEDQANVDDIIRKARKGRGLVLDLRNNPGGLVTTLEYIVGQFFDQPVTAGSMRRRATNKPWVIKPRSTDPYRGMLVVLVNSGSGSSSEILARIMQIEGRGVIVGDVSAGAVVTAMRYGHTVGFERKIPYTTQISVEDVVMSDGQRLEKVGVIPDHLVLPSGADIAARRDPQMAKALSLVGVTVTAEAAGALFRPSGAQTSER
jgi:C-terminal processing protease CtpA/Prc